MRAVSMSLKSYSFAFKFTNESPKCQLRRIL
jgi:hypothetical protein